MALAPKSIDTPGHSSIVCAVIVELDFATNVVMRPIRCREPGKCQLTIGMWSPIAALSIIEFTAFLVRYLVAATWPLNCLSFAYGTGHNSQLLSLLHA